MIRSLAIGYVLAATLSASTLEYVGSFRVDAGPSWDTIPLAYSGIEAAAHIWGGLPTDYVISTDLDNINRFAWYTIWGGGENGLGQQLPHDYIHNTAGYYLSVGDASAYANDWATGAGYTNYVFRAATAGGISAETAEPGSILLVGSAVALLIGRMFMPRRAQSVGLRTVRPEELRTESGEVTLD